MTKSHTEQAAHDQEELVTYRDLWRKVSILFLAEKADRHLKLMYRKQSTELVKIIAGVEVVVTAASAVRLNWLPAYKTATFAAFFKTKRNQTELDFH